MIENLNMSGEISIGVFGEYSTGVDKLEHYKDTYIKKKEKKYLYRGMVKRGGVFNLLLNSYEVCV